MAGPSPDGHHDPALQPEGRAASLEGALEGAVLLKNDRHTLPLDKTALHTVAVIGPTAAQTVTTGGGSGEVVSFASSSALTGIADNLGGRRAFFMPAESTA